MSLWRVICRLANDYLYQIRQWKGSDFIDEHAMQYFINNALKYKNRLLGYGIKTNKPSLITDALLLSNVLKNEICISNNISFQILEKVIRIRFISPIIQKIIFWLYK